MNLLSKLLIFIMVFSLLCGQTIFVFAQDDDGKKQPVKKLTDDTSWVGRGYDITDKYADVGSVREALFEKGEDEKGNLVIVGEEGNAKIDTDAKRTSKYDEFSGKSLSEYQSSFSNKLSIGGSYKIFSASVSVNFGTNQQSSVAKDYLTMSHTVTLRSYQMPFEVKSLIRKEAQEAIDSSDASELFERFGTHYIWQADVGGRVDYNVTFNRATSQKDINVQVTAKAEAKAVIASVSVENETSYNNSVKKLAEAGTVRIFTYGGNLDAGAKIKENRGTLAEWSNSVEANPTLCRFGDRSLRGIWTLAATSERQEELKAAFAKYSSGKEIKDIESKIEVRRVNDLKRVGENWYAKNSQNGSPYTIGVYAPVAEPDNGWYIVGHSADKNNRPETAATIDSILVKEIGETGKLLREPLGYEEIYNDKSTSGWKDWSIWKANCPVGFVALSYFAKYGHSAPNTNIPSENPFKDVRCVSEGLVEPAVAPTTANVIYNGEGSGGRNIMVYSIKPQTAAGTVDGNFFYTQTPGNYSDPIPSNLKLYVLKNPSAVKPKTENTDDTENKEDATKDDPTKNKDDQTEDSETKADNNDTSDLIGNYLTNTISNPFAQKSRSD